MRRLYCKQCKVVLSTFGTLPGAGTGRSHCLLPHTARTVTAVPATRIKLEDADFLYLVNEKSWVSSMSLAYTPRFVLYYNCYIRKAIYNIMKTSWKRMPVIEHQLELPGWTFKMNRASSCSWQAAAGHSESSWFSLPATLVRPTVTWRSLATCSTAAASLPVALAGRRRHHDY